MVWSWRNVSDLILIHLHNPSPYILTTETGRSWVLLWLHVNATEQHTQSVMPAFGTCGNGNGVCGHSYVTAVQTKQVRRLGSWPGLLNGSGLKSNRSEIDVRMGLRNLAVRTVMRGGSCPEVGMANAKSALLLVWPAMTRGQNVGVAIGGGTGGALGHRAPGWMWNH